MPKQKVLDLLEQLHTELAGADELDADTAERLRTSIVEIEEVLDNSPHVETLPLVQRLREAVYHLPDSHPLLKNTVGRVADALSQIGI